MRKIKTNVERIKTIVWYYSVELKLGNLTPNELEFYFFPENFHEDDEGKLVGTKCFQRYRSGTQTPNPKRIDFIEKIEASRGTKYWFHLPLWDFFAGSELDHQLVERCLSIIKPQYRQYLYDPNIDIDEARTRAYRLSKPTLIDSIRKIGSIDALTALIALALYAEKIEYDELFIEAYIASFHVLLVVTRDGPFKYAKEKLFRFFYEHFFFKKTPKYGFTLYEELWDLPKIDQTFDFLESYAPQLGQKLDSGNDKAKMIYRLWRFKALKKGLLDAHFPLGIHACNFFHEEKRGKSIDKFRSASILGNHIQHFPLTESALELMQHDVINEHL